MSKINSEDKMRFRIEKYNLFDRFYDLKNALETPEIVNNTCVMNKGNWTAGYKKNKLEGFVTNNGLIQANKYKLQLGKRYDIKRLSLYAKLFPQKAYKKATKMLTDIMVDRNNPQIVDRNSSLTNTDTLYEKLTNQTKRTFGRLLPKK